MITVNRFLASRVHAIAVLSEIERAKVARMYRVPQDRLRVIPLGVDIPEAIEKPKNGEIVILSVGRLEPGKGQLRLLDVFTKLLAQTRVQVRLVLAGPDGGDGDRISRYVDDHNLRGRVDVTGRVSDEQLQMLYRQADLFVLLSSYEAFGLAFVEAMAHRVPVVAYKVGALPEVLQDGAILVEPFDDASVLRAVAKLVEDDGLRQELGGRASRHVLGRYTWPGMTSSFLALYRESVS